MTINQSLQFQFKISIVKSLIQRHHSFEPLLRGERGATNSFFHCIVSEFVGNELALVHCSIYMDVSFVIVSFRITNLRRRNYGAFPLEILLHCCMHLRWNTAICHCFVYSSMQIHKNVVNHYMDDLHSSRRTQLNWLFIYGKCNKMTKQATTISSICLVFTSITYSHICIQMMDTFHYRFKWIKWGRNETYCLRWQTHVPILFCAHKIVSHHAIHNSQLLMMLKKYFHESQTHAINIVILMNNEKVLCVHECIYCGRLCCAKKRCCFFLFFRFNRRACLVWFSIRLDSAHRQKTTKPKLFKHLVNCKLNANTNWRLLSCVRTPLIYKMVLAKKSMTHFGAKYNMNTVLNVQIFLCVEIWQVIDLSGRMLISMENALYQWIECTGYCCWLKQCDRILDWQLVTVICIVVNFHNWIGWNER